VTQQNAAAAEELSSTAEEMAAQAASLLQLVSFFHLSEAEIHGRGHGRHGARALGSTLSGLGLLPAATAAQEHDHRV
jgi:methyl-accepting chemotaxis protein